MRQFSTTKESVEEIAKQVAAGELRLRLACEAEVAEIIEQVHERGDETLVALTRKFDCADFQTSDLTVTKEEIAAGAKAISPQLRAAMKRAIENVSRFHQRQMPSDWTDNREDGCLLGQKFSPINRVGIYAPKGETGYPSSLLMSAVPAQIAGVEELALASPPAADGSVRPSVLAAADLLGIEEIYRMGGPGAIAALALGTETVRKVDKIVGPGNMFIVTAKKLLYGIVGVDGIYGPSEVVVLADQTADPRVVAADLLAQAEHGPDSVCVLVTPDGEIAERTNQGISRQLAELSRKEVAEQALAEQGAVVVVNDLEEGIELINLLAPEHLQLMVQEPLSLLPKIKNAGCILVGKWSPVAAGDYLAGPSHLLPTGRTARFSSGLGVYDFLKRSSVIHASQEWLENNKEAIEELASAEKFDAHARSIRIRMQKR